MTEKEAADVAGVLVAIAVPEPLRRLLPKWVDQLGGEIADALLRAYWQGYEEARDNS